MIKDELGIRMKEYYENIPKAKLIRRTPVAIRLDGKSFHSFTRGFKKPFDEILIKAMQKTMKYLCENIQGCVFGYTQSDEITLILIDYKNLNSAAWLNYKVQKMCSIAASMATMVFNKFFAENVEVYLKTEKLVVATSKEAVNKNNECCKYASALEKAINKGALFDARVFNVPKEEVTNLIYWRQIDAIRNSIQMTAQTYFLDKEIKNKSSVELKNMLLAEKNINWESFPTYKKRGSCCIKKEFTVNAQLADTKAQKMLWVIDNDIPIFKGVDRAYIENLVFV